MKLLVFESIKIKMNDRSKDNLVTCYKLRSSFVVSEILNHSSLSTVPIFFVTQLSRGFKEYGSMSKTAVFPSPSLREHLRPAAHTFVYCAKCNVFTVGRMEAPKLL